MTTPDNQPVSENAGEPVADNANPEILVAEPVAAVPEPVAEPKPTGSPPDPRVARMKAIAERVKAKRDGEGGPEFTGDFTDPAQSAGVHGMQPADEPTVAEPAPVPVPALAEAPKKFKLKVDGQEFERDIAEVARLAEMTIEEVESSPERATRYAQKELASSRRLDQAKDILRSANQRPQEAPHRADLVPEPVAEPTQADDPLSQVVEEIQFGGDPKDNGKKLRQAIIEEARRIAREEANKQKVDSDFAIGNMAVNAFRSANQDLVNDVAAEGAMTSYLYEGFKEDLVKLGTPEDQIPKDRTELANYHSLARVQGLPVRSFEKLLDDTKSRYLAWRGTPGQQSQPTTPAPRPTQPRVAVDRTERRQAIPTQPTRASAPQSDPANIKPQPRTRSQTIMEMRKQRGQVTA